MLIDYHSLHNKRGVKETKKILTGLFGDEERLEANLKSSLLVITQVPEPKKGGSDDSSDEEGIEALRSAFSVEDVFATEQGQAQIETFDPLDKCIAGGLKRADLIKRIQELPALDNASEIFKTVLNLEDEKKLREISQALNKRIQDALAGKNYAAVHTHFTTFKKLDRIGHDYVTGLKGEIIRDLLHVIYEQRHQIQSFSMDDRFSDAETLLADLHKMREALKTLPECEFIDNIYKESNRFLANAKQKAAERKAQEEKIKALGSELAQKDPLAAQIAEDLAAKEARVAQLNDSLTAQAKASQEALDKLKAAQAAEIQKLAAAQEAAIGEERKKIEAHQKALAADYAAQLQKAEEQAQAEAAQQEELLKKEAQQKAELQAQQAALAAEAEKLKAQAAATLKDKNLTEIQGLLGNNYVGAEAWVKLGIQVRQLPQVSDKLLTEARRLQTKGEQPLLVLDLGKSIQEIERLCKAKGINVLSTQNSRGDEKLRAEACYTAPGTDCPRWLLLPGSDHGVLPGSRNKWYHDQVKYMEANYPGYEVGGARELVTLAMLKYLQDGTVLFPRDPLTLGRCKENFQTGGWGGNDWHICLGHNEKPAALGGSAAGLVVDDAYDYDYSTRGLWAVCPFLPARL